MVKENHINSLISPIKSVVLTVQNLAQSRRIFEEGFGMKCLGETETTTKEIGELWGVEKGDFRVARFAGNNGGDFGCVDLVENQAAAKSIRSKERPFDYGIFTLNFRTNNLEKAVHILMRLGARAVSKPMTYNVGKPIREVMFEMPTGERLTVLQLGEAIDDLPLFTEPIATFGMITPSMEDSIRFYRDALGMNLAITFQHSGPPFDELLGIKDKMSMDFATLTSDENWMGKVELLQLEVANQTPENTSEKTDFAHTGYTFLTFLTKNIEKVKQVCEKVGAKIVVEPFEVNRPFHEKRKAMIVRSLGGEYLEIIEEDFSES